MKRIIKFLAVCCFFCLAGCYGHLSSRYVSNDISAIDTTTVQETELNKINAIQAQGNFCLRITSGARKNHIRIKGLTSGVSAIDQKLHKNTLILTANEDKNLEKLKVDVQVVDLKDLKLRGMSNAEVKGLLQSNFSIVAENVKKLFLTGNIVIPRIILMGDTSVLGKGNFNIGILDNGSTKNIFFDKLEGKGLVINNKGPGLIALKGFVKLKQLNQIGSGEVKILWINNDDIMKVNLSGSGTVEIAGIVNKAELQIRENAKLNARYLRAKTVLINAANNSKAEVQALKQLMAYAEDNSVIKYYGKPSLIGGSVSQASGQGTIFRVE